MNEKEKKAIKKVKEIIYNPEFRNIILFDSEGFTGWNINFEIILNLIEKQQKEIEELKEENKELEDEQNRINYLEDLISTMEEYYSITVEDLENCIKNDK